MRLRRIKVADRLVQLAVADIGAPAAVPADVKKPDPIRRPLPPFQFFPPVVLKDVIDQLILKNVCHVLSNVAAGNFFVRKINYKKLALALSIEPNAVMRKRILDLLIDHAGCSPENLHLKDLQDMLARHALIEALPFLNEEEQLKVVKTLIRLYANLFATRLYFDLGEFLLPSKNWKYFLNLIEKACGEDLEICKIFFCNIFLAWRKLIPTDGLVALLPLIQKVIKESEAAENAQHELCVAAKKALAYLQCLPRMPKVALLARGIQPLHVVPAQPVVERSSLDELLRIALNDKDPNIGLRRRYFDVICGMINVFNHGQVIDQLLLNMRNKSCGTFAKQYCMLFAEAFQFASQSDREKIKSALLRILGEQAEADNISILEHVKKIMRYMPGEERAEFVRAAINKINSGMLLAPANGEMDEKAVALGQKKANLDALELLRECQIIRKEMERALQDTLTNQNPPVLLKPVTAIVARYARD